MILIIFLGKSDDSNFSIFSPSIFKKKSTICLSLFLVTHMPYTAAMDLARAFPGAASAQRFPSCKVSNAQDQATSQGAAVHLKLR
jgi:hypothetical protein